MVLSASHKVALRQMGYTARDVAEIGLALVAGEFTYKGENGRRISEGAAKTKLTPKEVELIINYMEIPTEPIIEK